MTAAFGPVTVNLGLAGAKYRVPPPLASLPVLRTMLPLVVVMAAPLIFTSCPATNVRPPSVVVTAAFMFTSRPAFVARLPLVAVIAALTLTSRTAFNVRVVNAPDAVQVTGSFTKISPFVPMRPLSLRMVTFVVTRLLLRVTPDMSAPAAIVKSFGSISQIPEEP